MPPTIPIICVLRSAPPTRQQPESRFVIPCSTMQSAAARLLGTLCFAHRNMSAPRRVKTSVKRHGLGNLTTRERSRTGVQEGRPVGVNDCCCSPKAHNRAGANIGGALGNLTTSFLSAAKLIYAIGAGVTAAAGRDY